jgi:hypothetical protein
LLLHGLPLLQTLLFEIKDHEHLVSVMERHLQRSYLEMEWITDENYQERQYHQNHTERHRKQDVRDPLPFQGDGDPTAPPLAWTVIWNGTYSTLFGEYGISRVLQKCGYVFWDALTLESRGAVEMIKRHRDERWNPDVLDHDFRDSRDVMADIVY